MDGAQLEQASVFKYLGYVLNEYGTDGHKDPKSFVWRSQTSAFSPRVN